MSQDDLSKAHTINDKIQDSCFSEM